MSRRRSLKKRNQKRTTCFHCGAESTVPGDLRIYEGFITCRSCYFVNSSEPGEQIPSSVDRIPITITGTETTDKGLVFTGRITE